ncbi:helix-turn-helix domain-containing protein [Vagococcus zengguangii]|nr:helix-turn-helix transcriptional regulator [Vagococcus zengguangii]
MNNLGLMLKEIREEKSFSKEMLSKDICSLEILEKLEVDNTIPSLSLLRKICDRLSVTIDELMAMCEVKASSTHRNALSKANWFSILDHYLITKQYDCLNEATTRVLIEMPDLSILENQLLMYYRGAYELVYERNIEGANKYFARALDFTYQPDSSYPSDMEVIIMTLLGFIRHRIGEHEEAQSLIEKSFELYIQHHSFSMKPIFSQLFYFQSTYQLEMGAPQEAIEIADVGISWCRKMMNMYLLEDLLYVKGIALEDLNRIDEATFFVELADNLHVLETSGEVISF